MAHDFISFFCELPLLKVVQALLHRSRPVYLRELSTLTGLSVGGTKDILRRLIAVGAVSETKAGNRKFYLLSIGPRERACIDALVELYTERRLEQRALRFSTRAAATFAWMDESYEFLRSVKERRR